MREVGVELYQQMLEEAIESQRNKKEDSPSAPQEHWSPSISLGGSILIPEDYVPDLSSRINLYRRLGDVTHNEEINALRLEILDRFGPIPDDCENLLKLITLKSKAKALSIDRIEAGDKGVILKFYQNRVDSIDDLLKFTTAQAGLAKIRPDQSIFFRYSWPTVQERFIGVNGLLDKLHGALVTDVVK